MTFPSTDNPNLTRFDKSTKSAILIRIVDQSKFWTTEPNGFTAGVGNDFADTYLDEITKRGLGTITRKINTLGGFTAVSDISFDILNQEKESNFLSPSVFFENDDIEIAIIFDDNTDLVFAERILLFVGVINSIVFDESGMSIGSVDLSEKEDEIVPQTTIDLVTFPLANIPDVGRGIQVVFGNFFNSTANLASISRSLVPTTGKTDISKLEYLVSERAIIKFGVPPPSGSGDFFKYVSGLNVYMPLTAPNSSKTLIAPASFKLGNDVTAELFANFSIFHPDDSGDITDITNMLDDDSSIFTSIAGSKSLTLMLPGFSDPGDFESDKSGGIWTSPTIFLNAGTISGGGNARLKYIPSPGVTPRTLIDPLVQNISNAGLLDDTTGAPDFPTSPTFADLREIGILIETDAGTTIQVKQLSITIGGIIIFFEPVERRAFVTGTRKVRRK